LDRQQFGNAILPSSLAFLSWIKSSLSFSQFLCRLSLNLTTRSVEQRESIAAKDLIEHSFLAATLAHESVLT
jgi:hypothetical protein